MSFRALDKVYNVDSADGAKALYDTWADSYESDLTENGYATPGRCADALAGLVADPNAPLAEFGCGTGLGGVALSRAGFTCIDGYDISSEMLGLARSKGIYRSLGLLDLSAPIDDDEDKGYANAAAIGVFNPNFMPATVLDDILSLLPAGGLFVFSLNDHTLAERSFPNRVLELTACGAADLRFKDHGEHLPGTGLESTVYVLERR